MFEQKPRIPYQCKDYDDIRDSHVEKIWIGFEQSHEFVRE